MEKIFGSSGIWSELLSRAEGYLGSELVLESKVERLYAAFDYWTSHVDFGAFRATHRAECDRFVQLVAFEGLLQKETFLGSYYEEGPDDETDIVPA